MSKDEPGRWTFLGHRVPPSFVARRVVVAPGVARPYEEAEWVDAVVVVKRGEIELECTQGGRCRFRAGDVLWLVGLPLRALHCCGSGPAVLLAVSRDGTDEFSAAPPSETH